MKLSSLMDPRLIYLDYHFDSYHQIIDFVAEKISLTTSLSTGTIKESLLKRENIGTTFLGNHLALPHGYVENLSEILILFIRLDRALDVSYDYRESTVKYVFAIITSKEKAQLYLKVLSAIAQLVTTNAHLLENARTPGELIDTIDEKQVVVDEVLRARDLICCKGMVWRKQTISHAIDKMKKENITFLPVVEENGRICGVLDLADLFSAVFPEEKISSGSLVLLRDLGETSELLVKPVKEFWENQEHHLSGDIMKDYRTYIVNENASYIEIVFIMTEYHYKYLVVVDDLMEVKGVIDTGDVVHKMIRA